MLADTCRNALLYLSRALIQYANDGYSLDMLEKLTSALFTIGSVETEIRSPDCRNHRKTTKLGAG